MTKHSAEDLRQVAGAWQSLNTEIERLEEHRETAASALNDVASTYFAAAGITNMCSRWGWLTIDWMDGESVRFALTWTNGRHEEESRYHAVTWEELAADPREIQAARKAREREEAEQQAQARVATARRELEQAEAAMTTPRPA